MGAPPCRGHAERPLGLLALLEVLESRSPAGATEPAADRCLPVPAARSG
jgi:hypothetical protein